MNENFTGNNVSRPHASSGSRPESLADSGSPSPQRSFDLSAMTLRQVEQALDLLTPKAPDELVLQLLELTAVLKRRAAEIRNRAEELAVAWIEDNGDLIFGNERYYAGHHKDTKCLNQRTAVEEVLQSVEGDLDRFCDLLVSQPLKHGACRSVLPHERYEVLFLTEQKLVLKDGKINKRLLKTNDAFNGRKIGSRKEASSAGGEEVGDE